MAEFDIFIRITGTRGGGEGKTTVARGIVARLIRDGYTVYIRNEVPGVSNDNRFHQCSDHPEGESRRAFVTTSLSQPDYRDLLEAGVIDDD